MDTSPLNCVHRRRRLQEIVLELDRAGQLPQAGLIEVDPTGGGGDVPGLWDGISQKSLEAHFTSRHAHVHKEARASLNRRLHTLFGLPQCRLCRQTLFDLASMERASCRGQEHGTSYATGAAGGDGFTTEAAVYGFTAGPHTKEHPISTPFLHACLAAGARSGDREVSVPMHSSCTNHQGEGSHENSLADHSY